MSDTITLYRHDLVTEATGITYRQLDHLVRSGHLKPTIPANGSGSRVRYSLDDVVRIKLAMSLPHFEIHERFECAAQMMSGSPVYFGAFVMALDVNAYGELIQSVVEVLHA